MQQMHLIVAILAADAEFFQKGVEKTGGGG